MQTWKIITIAEAVAEKLDGGKEDETDKEQSDDSE